MWIHCASWGILLGLLDNPAEDQPHSCHSSPQMILPDYNPYLLIPIVKILSLFITKPIWFRTNNSRKSVPTAMAVTQKAGWWPLLEERWMGKEFPSWGSCYMEVWKSKSRQVLVWAAVWKENSICGPSVVREERNRDNLSREFWRSDKGVYS